MRTTEIIGLAGTNGSGKDTLGDLREKHQGARKVSLSDILRTEASRRELSHERENLRAISTEWGRQMGAGALSLMTLRNHWETNGIEYGLSIVSVRRPEEARVIQEQGGRVIWIDAPRELRYQRVQAGMRDRIDDQVTYEQFLAQEYVEMYPEAQDSFAINMAGVRDMADEHIVNEFDSKEEYEAFLVSHYNIPIFER